MTTTYPIRLFGGRSLGVSYDNVAGTLSILGQSISISSIAAALQAEVTTAFATTGPAGKAAFGGDNISRMIGDVLDASPTWREAVRTALASYAAMNPANDPETWVH